MYKEATFRMFHLPGIFSYPSSEYQFRMDD